MVSSYRYLFVKQILEWEGIEEQTERFDQLINIYNLQEVVPRNTKFIPYIGWGWCALTVSAAGINLGYHNTVIPDEMSVWYFMDQAMKMGIWVEKDDYSPLPGDIILYDWQDDGEGDNVGVPDHIGIVTSKPDEFGRFIVTEGNYNKRVMDREVVVGQKTIRGYVVPKFTSDWLPTIELKPDLPAAIVADQVYHGQWGDITSTQFDILKAYGYELGPIYEIVAKLLADGSVCISDGGAAEPVALYARDQPEKHSKNMRYHFVLKTDARMTNGPITGKTMRFLDKNSIVHCYGYYSDSRGVPFLYVVYIDEEKNTTWTGFVDSRVLLKTTPLS